MTMASEVARMRASAREHRGTSVPTELVAAQHYAQRLEDRYKLDQNKIILAMARLEVIAAGLSPCDMPLQRALRDVVASLW